jgi:predicted dienelactone hydrolase
MPIRLTRHSAQPQDIHLQVQVAPKESFGVTSTLTVGRTEAILIDTQNFQDQSYTGNRRDLIDRPRQLKLVTDYMLTIWSGHEYLAVRRVGIFGFSLGGFMALVEAGGVPLLQRMRTLCSQRPDARMPIHQPAGR